MYGQKPESLSFWTDTCPAPSLDPRRVRTCAASLYRLVGDPLCNSQSLLFPAAAPKALQAHLWLAEQKDKETGSPLSIHTEKKKKKMLHCGSITRPLQGMRKHQ